MKRDKEHCMNCKSLLSVLIDRGLVSVEQLARAGETALQNGISEIDVLLRDGVISPTVLFEASQTLLESIQAPSDDLKGLPKPQPFQRDDTPSTVLEEIAGQSVAIRDVKDLIRKVAPTEATVLIQGESGTGKELVARSIHQLSRRAGAPMVTLNCSAIPPDLVESELFGHRKGAFTGAVRDHSGVFRAAHKGTLFLDEIEAMPMSMQVKLLRALEVGEIRGVGETVSSKVDVRFLCATNADLSDMAARGNFRTDLLFRINVFEIHIPPLRERGGDILLIAEQFLRRFERTQGGNGLRMDPPVMEVLCRYEWPGNVRQLLNELERCCIMCDEGSTISMSCLSRNIVQTVQANENPSEEKMRTLKESVEELEKEMVATALKDCEGNRTEAAKILGLSRQGLLNKIHKFHLDAVSENKEVQE